MGPKREEAGPSRRTDDGGAGRALSKSELEDLKQEADFDDHTIPLKDFYQRYQTNPMTGISLERVKEMLARDGLNVLTPPKTTPEWVKFCQHMFYGFAVILWFGTTLCFVAYTIELYKTDEPSDNHLYLGTIILIVVVISGIFSYYQDRSSSKIMDSFKSMVSHMATVVREGKIEVIDASQLVRGDVVLVKFGDKVPADIRIIECYGLKVDNSSLTGETEAQARGVEATNPNPLETQNLAFYSTSVLEGTCKGVVFQTGDTTIIGRLAVLTVGLKREDSPITKEIAHFVRIITIVSFSLSAIFFSACLFLVSVVEAFIYFIALLVANVPEGLLVTVTLCLTLTAKKMAKKNCLIKSLDSVETLGSTSTICSDKTGTLTQNRMTVTELVYNFQVYPVKYSLDRNTTVNNAFDIRDPDCKNLTRCGRLCLRAQFEGDLSKPILQRNVDGDASEAGILKCMECIFGDVDQYRKNNPKVAEIPFNSTNKYQLSIHRTEGKTMLVMKGAPERILELCSTVSCGGSNQPMSQGQRNKIEDLLLELGGKGERVLGFADIELSDPPGTVYNTDRPNFPTKGLRFLGLMALIDPPREAVPDAVAKCRTAGIRVIMVTGDHPVTAEAIARQVGIITKETRKDISQRTGIPEKDVRQSQVKATVITGDQLRRMDSQQLDDCLKYHSEIVFARTTPTQKLLIVEGCQRLGLITAVTGDGVNDSPALKKADIGIAMGITGSDVSKQAADMILLDDNFASIITGVEEGRIIFDNLKKSITYSLTSNIPEMAPFIAFIIFKMPMPLSIIAILVVDVGTDLLPAIALAYEGPETDIMLRQPRNPFYDKLVNRRLIWMAYGQIGIIQTLAGFCAYFVVMSEFGFLPEFLFGVRDEWDNPALNSLVDSYGQQWSYPARKGLEYYSNSAFFAAIIVTQLADGVICKTRKNSIFQQGMSNWVLNAGLLVAVGLGCILLYTPGLDKYVLLPGIYAIHWLPGVPFAIVIFLFDEIRRLIIRRRPGGWVERETYY